VCTEGSLINSEQVWPCLGTSSDVPRWSQVAAIATVDTMLRWHRERTTRGCACTAPMWSPSSTGTRSDIDHVYGQRERDVGLARAALWSASYHRAEETSRFVLSTGSASC
jgi:hypothetical protein